MALECIVKKNNDRNKSDKKENYPKKKVSTKNVSNSSLKKEETENKSDKKQNYDK